MLNTSFRTLIAAALIVLLWACAPNAVEPLALHSGSDSAEPHLAVGSNGEIILSYLQPEPAGTALRFSVLQDGRWSTPRSVSSGTDWLVNWADYPSVEAVRPGLWAAHWLVKSNPDKFAYDAFLATSTDAGDTWSEPIKLNRDETPTEHGFVSLYPAPQDRVGAIWLDGRALAAPNQGGAITGTQLRTAYIDVAGAHSDATVIDPVVCDCCQTDLAISSQGPIAAYRNRSSEEIRDIYVTRLVDRAWTQGERVAKDDWKITGCPVNGPAIAALGDRVAVAWFTAVPTNRVRLALSHDAGTSFGQALDVAIDSTLGRVDVAYLPDGTIAVSWLQRGKGSLMVRMVDADGSMGEAIEVAPMETHRDAGFPQMVSAGERLVFAWTDTSGAHSRVVSATLTR